MWTGNDYLDALRSKRLVHRQDALQLVLEN